MSDASRRNSSQDCDETATSGLTRPDIDGILNELRAVWTRRGSVYSSEEETNAIGVYALNIERDNARLRERVAALENALRPFATYGRSLPADARAEWPMNDAGSREGRADMPTVGDCRRAAELLKGDADVE